MSNDKNYDYTQYNKNLIEPARKLRKEMTPQERHLWFVFLKNYPVKFVRQRPIYKFIADFYCSRAKLIIEIDGSQHYTEEGIEYDSIRSEIINILGVEVIRFSNYDIDNNFEGVCFEIDRIVSERVGERMKVFSDPSVGCADISTFRGDKTDYN